LQPEIHTTDPVEPAPAGDLLPPQRRKGIPRVTVILGAGLLVAAAFLGGIQAQKQWGDDSSGGGNFASRFAAANDGTGASAAPGGQTGQGAGGFFGRRGGGFTTGTVKLVQGSTLYVTTTDGNVVKVSVPASTTITKSVTTKVSGIKPGDSVTAIGTTSNGVVKATSVRVGDTGLPAFRGAGARGTQGAQGGAPTPPSP
jgi:Cu/Ag efflux protein CusF